MAGTTTKGAVVGGFVGLITAVAGVVLRRRSGNSCSATTEGFRPFRRRQPDGGRRRLAFVVIWLVSKMDSSAAREIDRAGWDAQFVRSQTGIGATGASAH